MTDWESGTLAFIGGALTLLAGVILVARPGVGLAVLTLIVGAYLLVDGIFGAVLAFNVRPQTGLVLFAGFAMISIASAARKLVKRLE